MSEIEKQFFKTFGIPPLCCKKYLTNCMRYDCESCENFDNTFSTYQQITDRILLKLLSIQSYDKSCYTLSPFDSIDELKKDLLNEFIEGYTYDLYNDREDVKHQVQALFKENN